MDARPQRPLRPLHGDENLTTIPPSSKPGLAGLQQKPKPMSSILGIKMSGKPNVLRDLSNVSKALSRDDVGQNNKSDGLKIPVPHVQQNGVPRPASRPFNVVLSHPSLHEEPENDLANYKPFTQAVQTDNHIIANKPAKRPLISTVYKDEQFEEAQPILAPIQQGNGPRHHKSQPQLRQEQHGLRRIQSIAGQSKREPILSSLGATTVEYDASDDVSGEVDEYSPALETQETSEADYVDSAAVTKYHNAQAQPIDLSGPTMKSEPEEYWEEGDEQEYDEHGYASTYSYQTRGDNTTGGATTVFFPILTQKIAKELMAAKEVVEMARTHAEIEDERWDTSMVAEYGDEIFGYMRELEVRMLPNPHYMDIQAEIQWSMRAVLMDWMVQVHNRFNLLPETLFLTVNYIDRFLSCKIVSLPKLQLVGATAIFVAAKYEEINCPSVAEIVYMVDNGYNVDEILKAERFMLSMLQFELGWPGPMSFLRRISKADDYDLETRTLAKYFLEVTIMDERFVGTPPSFGAAAGHCLARLMLKKGDWSTAHVHYSGYTYAQLRPLIAVIVNCLDDPARHHSAVYQKYTDKRYKRASIFAQKCLREDFDLPPAQLRRSIAMVAWSDHYTSGDVN